jgi:hypothetical protein
VSQLPFTSSVIRFAVVVFPSGVARAARKKALKGGRSSTGYRIKPNDHHSTLFVRHEDALQSNISSANGKKAPEKIRSSSESALKPLSGNDLKNVGNPNYPAR